MPTTTTIWTRLHDGLTHVAFLLWAIAAVYFYQERLYSDSAFYLGKVIHYEQFWVELSRYVLVFSQWLPLLLVKLGASMKAVLIAYSVGNVLFFYGVYLWGRYRWGSGSLGWFLVGAQTIGITQGFATPMFELYYTSAFLGLWVVLLYKNEASLKVLLGLGLLAGWVALNYMLAMWLLGGLLVLHRLGEGRAPTWRPEVATILGMLTAFVLKQWLTHHSYEEAKMEQFILNLTTRTYAWQEYWRPLLGIYAQHYRMLSALAVGTVVAYLYQRRFLIALGYIGWVIATQYIVALTYPHIAHSRYQEQCYFIGVMAILLPLLFDLMPTWKPRAQAWMGVFLFGMTTTGLAHIAHEMDFFTQRVAYLHRLIEAGRAQHTHKLIIEEHRMPHYMHSPSFTFSVESMLLSALQPQQRTVHVIRDTEWVHGDNAQTLQDSSLYLSTFRSFYERPDSIYVHSAAPKQYYHFPPEPYHFARGRYPTPDTLIWIKDSIQLTTTIDSSYAAGSTVLLDVTVHNHRAQGLGAAPISVSYHLWTTDYQVIQWDHDRTALEFDVPPYGQYTQPLPLPLPKEPGRYLLQLDLIGEKGQGWLHHPAFIAIQVE